MSPIRLLIAEDSTLVRRLLAHQMERENGLKVVGEAADGREAVTLARSLRPDVVLMDLEMPGLNGVEATEKILSEQTGVCVILLTSHETLAPMGKLAGATEALHKGCTPQELTEAIRRAYRTRSFDGLHAGGSGGSSRHGVAGSQAADGSNNSGRGYHSYAERVAAGGRLTARERAVLEKSMDTELTTQQIATVLTRESGEEVTISAVKHTLERIMNKLQIEPRTRAALIRFVLEFDRKCSAARR